MKNALTYVSYILLISFVHSLLSCATVVSVEMNEELAERGLQVRANEIMMFEKESDIKFDYETVGQVNVMDSGFSLNCEFHNLISTVKQEASRAGAEGAYFVEIRPPSWQSTCYQGIANLIVKNRKQSIPSILEVENHGIGTAFLISEDGILVTNNHVVKDFSTIWVSSSASGGMPLETELIYSDPLRDLAFLKIKDRNKLPKAVPFAFRSFDSILLGEEVTTLGYPLSGVLNNDLKLTTGVISSLSGLSGRDNEFQTTVQIQPGSSGGPLIDRFGNLVGVIVSSLSAAKLYSRSGAIPQNVNFAIKSDGIFSSLSEMGYRLPRMPVKKGKNLRPDEIGSQFGRMTFRVIGK